MDKIKSGDTVRFHYTGTLPDGTVFDSSDGGAPLSCTVGAGEIIEGLDAALTGMVTGEEKSVNIPCALAYGPINPALRQPVPRAAVPDDIPLEVGGQLQMQTPQGQPIPVTIASLSDEEILLDANHPLAGQDLRFVVTIAEVVAA